MSSHYKEVKNGKGTNLTISEGRYITVGTNGRDIMLRGDGKVLGFDSWDELINAIDTSKASYFLKEETTEFANKVFDR